MDKSHAQKTFNTLDAQEEIKLKTKYLVCISASPSSEKIIKWTARNASSNNAKWIALYVKTPESIALTEKENNSLNHNINLVSALGGEVVKIEGYDIAKHVSEYVRQQNISDIVLGKYKNRKFLGSIFEKDLESQITSLLDDDVEVHIIHNSLETNHEHLKIKTCAIDLLKTALIIIFAMAISYLLKLANLKEFNIVLVFLIAIMSVSISTKGYFYGILSALLCAIILDYFFINPVYSLKIFHANYLVLVLIYIFIAVFLSAVTIKAKKQTINSIIREKRLENLYVLSQKVLKIRGYKNIIEFINNYLSAHFKSEIKIFVKGEEGFYHIISGDELKECTWTEFAAVDWVYNYKKAVGKNTKTFSDYNEYYVPIQSQDTTFAVISVSHNNGTALSNEEMTFLDMASYQFALALERQRLSDGQNSMLISAEKEKIRTNLLRSVSHDLRTPLTSIYGCANTLSLGLGLDEKTKTTLIETIKDDSQWLIRMVENLLTVTKIQGEGLKINKQAEALEEIIAEAVERVSGRLTGQNINVSVPDELLIVPMDATLILQVIINLLDNAIRHSEIDKDIDIRASRSGNFAVIKVLDCGRGLKAEQIAMIEQGMLEANTKSNDSKKGMGIGLTICYSIIKAHGGALSAGNRYGGGAEFTMWLPLEE